MASPLLSDDHRTSDALLRPTCDCASPLPLLWGTGASLPRSWSRHHALLFLEPRRSYSPPAEFDRPTPRSYFPPKFISSGYIFVCGVDLRAWPRGGCSGTGNVGQRGGCAASASGASPAASPTATPPTACRGALRTDLCCKAVALRSRARFCGLEGRDSGFVYVCRVLLLIFVRKR